MRDEIENLIAQLQSDQRPGNKIPRIGYDVYKTRLPNPSAARGKSGGFRVVYYVQMADSVILLTIYSKTSKNDISVKEIQRAVEDVTSPDVL